MAGLLDEQALAQLLAMGRAGDTIGGLLNFSRSPPQSGGLLGIPDAVAPKPFGLADTWPARLAQTLFEAAKLPGDVYTGKQPSYLGLRSNDYTDDPTAPDPNQHLTEGAGDLAGLMGLGAMPMPQRGAAGALGGKLVQPEGIRAYHGSPHDFDRFNISKIGTGEGAQSYGHGLYFAEAEPVARAYRDKLGGQNINSTARFYLQRAGGDQEKAIAALDADFARSGMPDKAVQENIRQQIAQGSGRMYEVNINAKPEQFLDWDRPLAEQSLFGRLNEASVINDKSPPHQKTGQAPGRALIQTPGDIRMEDRLREAGIPGIKYLDQGSRSAGQGTNNYVLFDDKIIDILRKYGLAGLLGGGASAKVNAPGMLDN